ncbi:MAG: LacI family transcriptional regulator [Opitutaceae bacterium]|jgi:DNA-binding LacI/PurR family transcriptional regulator|nr:LacI family transcriptional regulator [Opitutaceae bacterium]
MNTFISGVQGSRPAVKPAAKQPTLREVAKVAGVSLASASYALRGHPTVSEATRRHVAAVAAQAGYRPNPQLAAFMQARRTGRSMRTDASVALVYGGPSLPAEGESYFGLCLRGIHAVATDRGYALDPVRWDAADDPDAARLRRILDQRGIRGLLLMPADRTSRWTLPLDWSRFFGVALDLSIRDAPVHRVADHHAADMLTALTRVKAAGWRRPGLVLDPLNNERTCEMRLGAWLARMYRDFPDAPPPLLVPSDGDRAGRLREWLRRSRPDVVLSPDRGIASLLPSAGRGRSGACAFVSLANYTERPPWSGIFIDGVGVGRTAAFLLFSLLENPQTAAVLRPQTILVEGRWHEM